jgi:hypothetical protein
MRSDKLQYSENPAVPARIIESTKNEKAVAIGEPFPTSRLTSKD